MPVVLGSIDDLGFFREIGTTRHTRIKDEGNPATGGKKVFLFAPNLGSLPPLRGGSRFQTPAKLSGTPQRSPQYMEVPPDIEAEK